VSLGARVAAALAAALLAACAAPPAAPPTHVNALGMTFVRVPPGEFAMGSDEAADTLARAYPTLERERFAGLADEAPVHRVRITHAFWLGRTEVTVGQFRRFVEASGHVPESIADGTGGYGWDPSHVPERSPRGDAFAGRDPRWSWRDPGWPQDDDHPVVNVTWHDAVAMARWLSALEGRRYRLPTEAEWEYACRAGTTTRYASGDDPASLAGHANVFDLDAAADWPRWATQALPVHDGFRFTAPVARFAPNAFGLHDMHGNVWEWTADRYGDDYYARSPVDAPGGPVEGHLRVRRGGSWHTWPFYARCSFRNWNAPSTRYTLVGFRLLLEDDDVQR
jgi:formylglycine-generating enzyme required for sulfatase activity